MVNKNKTKRNGKKSVKFNLRKNKTRRFNKKENTLRKQKRRQRKTDKKQKRRRRQKQNKTLRKTMKGGAIPFSEITEVYDNLKHSFHDAVDVFKDTPATVPANPTSSNVDPNVSKQFLRTASSNNSSYNVPDLKGIYDSAYP